MQPSPGTAYGVFSHTAPAGPGLRAVTGAAAWALQHQLLTENCLLLKVVAKEQSTEEKDLLCNVDSVDRRDQSHTI